MGKAGSLQWAVFQTEGWGNSLNSCYFPGTQGLHTHACACTHTCTHMRIYTRTHICTHTCTHVHAHAHIHTCAHTREHTHARMHVHRETTGRKEVLFFKASCRNSQVVQWLRISLPMQRAWFWPQVQGDSSCYRASEPALRRKSHRNEKPMHHSQEKPALSRQLEKAPTATKTQQSQNTLKF